MKHLPFITFALSSAFVACVAPLHAAVAVYTPPAEVPASAQYRVTVLQGSQRQESFVYQDECQDASLRDRMTDFNHWTTFSFSGPIRVEVTRLHGAASGAAVLPGRLPCQADGNTLTFALERPAKVWVKFPGMEENPLFIFADPPEVDVPVRGDPNVIWFEHGKTHDIGDRFRIKSGQTVYIEGGAIVRGTLTADEASHVTVRGRGILSGRVLGRREGVAGIPFTAVLFNGRGTDQHVEGITITDPPHFCILSRGQLDVRNVKLFGWWYQTDGWGAGDDSSISDSFLKVNDDNIKFYGRNQVARRLVIYQQINGAPFQLGWGGAGQSAQHCLAEDIDVIACTAAVKTEREANQAFINLRHQSAESRIEAVTVRHVRAECDLPMLVGLIDVAGKVSELHLEDIAVSGRITGHNFIRCKGAGSVSDVSLTRVQIGSTPVSTTNAGMTWQTTGSVAPLTFTP